MPGRCRFSGKRHWRVMTSVSTPRTAAISIRAQLMISGLKDETAALVAGNVPLNARTPKLPRSSPADQCLGGAGGGATVPEVSASTCAPFPALIAIVLQDMGGLGQRDPEGDKRQRPN